MQNVNEEPHLLSVDLTAARLGIGRSLAWDLVRSGQLSSIKIGARRLVPASEVGRFVEHLRAHQAASLEPTV